MGFNSAFKGLILAGPYFTMLAVLTSSQANARIFMEVILVYVYHFFSDWTPHYNLFMFLNAILTVAICMTVHLDITGVCRFSFQVIPSTGSAWILCACAQEATVCVLWLSWTFAPQECLPLWVLKFWQLEWNGSCSTW